MKTFLLASAGALVLSLAAVPAIAQDLGSPPAPPAPGGGAPATTGSDDNQCHPGVECVLLSNQLGIAGPVAAQPYDLSANALATLEQYNMLPGSRGVAGFRQLQSENAGMCRELGVFAGGNMNLYRQWAAMFPFYDQMEQVFIDLEGDLRNVRWARRGAGVLQILSFLSNPIEWIISQAASVLGYEVSGSVSDREREASRQLNLGHIQTMRLSITSNMLNNREREFWARRAFGFCSDQHAADLQEGIDQGLSGDLGGGLQLPSGTSTYTPWTPPTGR